MADAKTEKAPYPEHPLRCQSSGANGGGQCPNIRLEGSEYCIMHGGARGTSEIKKEKAKMYRLTKFQGQLDEMLAAGSDSSPILGLRNEIGIARMTLQEILNRCDSGSDLVIQSQSINQTLQLIGKLVIDAKKLESSLGHLLDKSTVVQLADEIVKIISSEVDDPETLTKIASDIGAAIERAVMVRANKEEEK